MGDLIDLAELELVRKRMQHLHMCSMQGFFDRQFINSVWQRDPGTLTERQRNFVMKLAWKYRRQIGPKDLVPPSDPGYAARPAPAAKVQKRTAEPKLDRKLFRKDPVGQGMLL